MASSKFDLGALAFILAIPAVVGVPRVAHAQDIDACIGASEKAQALRKKMNLIDERAELSQCAASACPDQVSSHCRERLAEVNKAIPSIILVAKDGSGGDFVEVKLTIDGAPRADHLDGTAVALNPGKHTFVLEAAGQEPVTRDFVLVEGERDRRETIVIGQPPPSLAPVPAKVASADQPSGDSTQKTLALVVAGVGVAALIAGGTLGALTITARNDYEQNCGSNIGAPPGSCNKQGVSGEQDTATKGNLSTVFLIGGGVLAATGTVWFLLAPRAPSGVSVGLGPMALTLRTQF
jgi:hypothetical protein